MLILKSATDGDFVTWLAGITWAELKVLQTSLRMVKLHKQRTRIHRICRIVSHFKNRLGALMTSDKLPTTMLRGLREEYGHQFFDALFNIPLRQLNVLTKIKRSRELARARKEREQQAKSDISSRMRNNWPLLLPKDHAFACAKSYFEATSITVADVCASCARQKQDNKMTEIIFCCGEEPPLVLDVFRITDPYILSKTDPKEFEYVHSGLTGMLLAKSGIEVRENGECVLTFCSSCSNALASGKLPKYALNNGLYRGVLPEEFRALTWVEEMVCCRFSTTAQVVRLYQSSSPSDPFVLYGNNCAHEMNVVSTANVLHRTSADIQGQLSIVFVGPGLIKPQQLNKIFRIDKVRVWRFLVWLKENNRLYSDLELSMDNLDTYEEDGSLPNLAESIIHQVVQNPHEQFDTEAAGLSEHPARIKPDSFDEGAPDRIFLESMGVSDPEGAHIKPRLHTAPALRQLLPKASDKPD